VSAPLPVFAVCEDGHEYHDRFTRLLGGRFQFARAGSYAEAAALAGTAVGLLLDLDFRRTPAAALIDEQGEVSPAPVESERRRLSATQGILILRALRHSGVTLPALLFADLDDREQVAYLQRELAPLRVIAADVGLSEIARALDDIATTSPG
jgi:hypothetical protein